MRLGIDGSIRVSKTFKNRSKNAENFGTFLGAKSVPKSHFFVTNENFSLQFLYNS